MKQPQKEEPWESKLSWSFFGAWCLLMIYLLSSVSVGIYKEVHKNVEVKKIWLPTSAQVLAAPFDTTNKTVVEIPTFSAFRRAFTNAQMYVYAGTDRISYFALHNDVYFKAQLPSYNGLDGVKETGPPIIQRVDSTSGTVEIHQRRDNWEIVAVLISALLLFGIATGAVFEFLYWVIGTIIAYFTRKRKAAVPTLGTLSA